MLLYYSSIFTPYLENKTKAVFQNYEVFRLCFVLQWDQKVDDVLLKNPRLVWVSTVWILKALQCTNKIARHIQRKRSSGLTSQSGYRADVVPSTTAP